MHSLGDSLVPPDGGWGWMVVFGTALTNVFNQSLLSIFGLLFGEKLMTMGLTSFGTSWVANIMLLVTNFSGIISGPALKRYSPRSVAMIGSFLSGAGMIASAFSTNVWQLILSYSILTGLGIGFIQPSSFLAVNSYFTSKKGMAVGIAMAGTGIGQFLMPQLVGILLDKYGFKGTTLILGSLAFSGILGASLFQPVKWHMKPKIQNEEPELISLSSDVDDNTTTYGSIKMKRNVSMIEETTTTINDVTISLPLEKSCDELNKPRGSLAYLLTPIPSESDLQEVKKDTIWTKIKRVFDLDLLKSFTFLNILLACGLFFTSNQSFNMFFPLYLQQEIHLDRAKAAMCMSALAAADIVGRISLPTLCDRYKITSRTTFYCSCLSLALARIVLCFQTQYIYVLLACTLCGFFRAILVVNQNLIVSEHCKDYQEKLPAALGLAMVMKGISVISIGQLLGWVRDVTQSYVITIHAQNSLLFIIFALWTPEILYKYLNKKKG